MDFVQLPPAIGKLFAQPNESAKIDPALDAVLGKTSLGREITQFFANTDAKKSNAVIEEILFGSFHLDQPRKVEDFLITSRPGSVEIQEAGTPKSLIIHLNLVEIRAVFTESAAQVRQSSPSEKIEDLHVRMTALEGQRQKQIEDELTNSPKTRGNLKEQDEDLAHLKGISVEEDYSSEETSFIKGESFLDTTDPNLRISVEEDYPSEEISFINGESFLDTTDFNLDKWRW